MKFLAFTVSTLGFRKDYLISSLPSPQEVSITGPALEVRGEKKTPPRSWERCCWPRWLLTAPSCPSSGTGLWRREPLHPRWHPSLPGGNLYVITSRWRGVPRPPLQLRGSSTSPSASSCFPHLLKLMLPFPGSPILDNSSLKKQFDAWTLSLLHRVQQGSACTKT